MYKLESAHTAAVKAGNYALAYEIALQIFQICDAEAKKGPAGRNNRKNKCAEPKRCIIG
jgi:hypothetical protein